MKKIEAVIQPFKLDKIREILKQTKIARISISEVKGAGAQQCKEKAYRGAWYLEDSTEVKIEILVDDNDAEHIADMIIDALRTGDLCDGEVIIVPVEQCFRMRAGHSDDTIGWARGPEHRYFEWRGVNIRSYLGALRKKFH